jgi:serine/threonine-protein kinase RsbT
MIIGLTDKNEEKGIFIVAEDKGPGIPDIELAMKDGYSTSKGLGIGLPGCRRIMDEFEIVSKPGAGTTVTIKKWKR